jgi:hypothetical protein
MLLPATDSGLRIGSGGVRDVAVLGLAYLAINSTQDFRYIETDINAVQNWRSENYMDLKNIGDISFPCKN